MISARFYNGLNADAADVGLEYVTHGETGMLVIRSPHDRSEIDRWAAPELYSRAGRKGELRIGTKTRPEGARIVVSNGQDAARVLATLPILRERKSRYAQRQIGLLLLSTMALVSVIGAYIFGVPILASRLVLLVPPAWEESLGDTVATQMAESFSGGTSFELCDEDPTSLANQAIARFGAQVMEGSNSPFALNIRVVKSTVPNAFALPGGNVYIFSGLMDIARTQHEFAGVLAHELGHVAHRDGMEQLISTAGTGLLIGFVLGDLTGISVAAGLGATLIDARFSREAELKADRFAADAADRMDFNAAGLANLVERISEDNAYTRALALFNTHPLTQDRKAALDAVARERQDELKPPFSEVEWGAIRIMCLG
jgi:Zn-dependent protease with chaperone function